MTKVNRTWPITRAELLGAYATSRLEKIGSGLYLALMLLIGVGNLSRVFWEDSPPLGFGFLVWVVLPVWSIAADLRTRVKRHRWKTLGPRIWEADGCICPWCEADVRTSACTPHGVGPEHRDLLVGFYATFATGDRSFEGDDPRLIERVPRPPRFRLARRRLMDWWVDQRRIFQDREATWPRRIGVALRLAAGYYLVSGVLLACLIGVSGLTPNFAGRDALWIAFWLILPALYMVIPIDRKLDRICVSCQQRCPNLEQDSCSECGQDLHVPGKTTRTYTGDAAPTSMLVVFGAAFLFVAIAPLIGETVMGLLPEPARRSAWIRVGAPMGYFNDLDVTQMTPEQAMAEADLVLQLARPGGPGIEFNFDRNLIGDALELGLLPESYRMQAARLTVSASIELERSDVGSEIVVTPRIGPSLLGNRDDARFAFGGVSIDGGPRSPGAPSTLRFHDLDPDARERGPSSLQPESKLTFRVPVDLAPGVHRIEARCWIVVDGSTPGKLDLEFDARGDPKFSPEAFVYDLPLVLDVETP
ncbi:hypothetical protein N9411_00060 [bacterium]|nr:hypothetical protein [bacterium]